MFVADISRSGQCTVSLHKAAVRTLLFPPNRHLPGSLLRSGFCFVVPRKVSKCYSHSRCQTPSSPLCSSSPRCLHAFALLSFSVYSGHQSILIPPFELESCLPLWLSTLSQYRIRDTFCSYSVMELCTKGLGTQTELLKVEHEWQGYSSLLKVWWVTFGDF